MKVILWMGISLNGIIAREDNKEDFISHDSWIAWLDVLKENRCLIFGRKTYEIVKSWDKQYFDDLKDFRKIVVTNKTNFVVQDGFELANSPQEALTKLDKERFKSVVLTGGSNLNSSFARLNLIDEVIFNIEPIIVGKGIPVFNPQLFDLKLEIIEMKQSVGKTIMLSYKVVKSQR